jgi:hypothetical protein
MHESSSLGMRVNMLDGRQMEEKDFRVASGDPRQTASSSRHRYLAMSQAVGNVRTSASRAYRDTILSL